ncbi:MAG: hypothetical protein Q8Q12_04545 [bacterium]|nr:hypothetical protein [bacterium]
MRLPKSPTVLRLMRQARLRRLRNMGFVLGGSLVRFPGHTSLYLTDKGGGKTRTLYIPLSRLEEVKKWNANYKLAKRLVAELSEIQRKLLIAEIAARSR